MGDVIEPAAAGAICDELDALAVEFELLGDWEERYR
jgi:hypothetical protein